MAQVKIYAIKDCYLSDKQALSNVIHSSLVSSLKLPEDKKFQRFIWLEKEDFIFPEDRTERYAIIEITLFSGRTIETKQLLIKTLIEQLNQQLAISTQDIEIVLVESPPENWGIRGKLGNELILNYQVKV